MIVVLIGNDKENCVDYEFYCWYGNVWLFWIFEKWFDLNCLCLIFFGEICCGDLIIFYFFLEGLGNLLMNRDDMLK